MSALSVYPLSYLLLQCIILTFHGNYLTRYLIIKKSRCGLYWGWIIIVFHLNFLLSFDYCFWLFSFMIMICLKSMILVYFIYRWVINVIVLGSAAVSQKGMLLYRDCNLNLLSLYSNETNLFYMVLVYYYAPVQLVKF